MVFQGCYTAMITPVTSNREVDYEGLKTFVEYQVEGGVTGLLVMGTTGESAVMSWDEHEKVIEDVHAYIGGRVVTIAGTGSNSTAEALKGTAFASSIGVEAALLVDPYYNGPSSLEIRREYVEPIARRFPQMEFIPYVIPGRTGCQLFPQDLAILHATVGNVNAVKEATGDLKNMALTRRLCGDDFAILSGDDDKTYEMMASPEIKANGVISVISNIVPGAVQKMVERWLAGDPRQASAIAKALDPLFKIVTVRTEEPTAYGPRLVRARNPLPCKTLMNVLGMPSGPCWQPLGKMTAAGLKIVLDAARAVFEATPWVFEAVETFFAVDLQERLYTEKYWRDLHYA